MSIEIFKVDQPFKLESGQQLDSLKIAYSTYGTLNTEITNVVLVFHALTANSDVMSWWQGLFGEEDFFNPKDNFIICANVLGSPYGSSSPDGLDFPEFTVRDVVNAQLLLLEELGIGNIKVLIGGSFGGSQALEFAYSFQGKIENMILIASAASESAWGIAIHESQRLALKADNTFGEAGGGRVGLIAARAIGMLTYRTSGSFIESQSDDDGRVSDFKAASYIRYQANKLEQRFNALSYYYLSQCMDSHNIGRDREGIRNALSLIETRTLVIGIDSDQLLPTHLQKFMVANLPNATYSEIKSSFGHDGFLIETEKLSKVIRKFIVEKQANKITVDELAEMFNNEENFQLIDVREPFEVLISTIGGINIPLKDVPARLTSIAHDKKVVVYCRSGKRSASAIEYIEEWTGHEELFNLEGGIIEWAQKVDNTVEIY
jgi:homoserine O-acetyltransferase